MSITDLDSDILDYIVANDLQVGDRLPSLTELSVKLNISVGKLREQLALARNLGLVAVKPKAGIQINEFNFAAAITPGLLYGLARCEHNFEAYKTLRNATTAAFWVEAVSQLQADDLLEIHQLLAAAWDKLEGPNITIPHVEHRQFHLTVFKRLDNPFVIGIEAAYWTAYEAVELNRYVDYHYLKTVWQYHERMVESIEGKEFEESKKTFVEHTKLLESSL